LTDDLLPWGNQGLLHLAGRGAVRRGEIARLGWERAERLENPAQRKGRGESRGRDPRGKQLPRGRPLTSSWGTQSLFPDLWSSPSSDFRAVEFKSHCGRSITRIGVPHGFRRGEDSNQKGPQSRRGNRGENQGEKKHLTQGPEWGGRGGDSRGWACRFQKSHEKPLK